MNTKGLLDQLFKQGSELLSANSKTSASGSSSGLGGLLSGKTGAALGGGALGLLLGSKKGRKMGGKILTYGGLAALGVVAYKAYSNYQQQQSAATRVEPQTIDRLPAPQAEQHSHAILRAIIGAAKADGHIDDKERQLIDNEIARLTSDDALQHWFDAELKKPLDPAEIASSAATPEMAAEMYLASVLVVDAEGRLLAILALTPTSIISLYIGFQTRQVLNANPWSQVFRGEDVVGAVCVRQARASLAEVLYAQAREAVDLKLGNKLSDNLATLGEIADGVCKPFTLEGRS